MSRLIVWSGLLCLVGLLHASETQAEVAGVRFAGGPFVGLDQAAVSGLLQAIKHDALRPDPGAIRPDAEGVQRCLQAAARHHGVSVALLQAIAQVESGGNPLAINRQNRNGSRDLGLMQINSNWLPKLAQWQIRESDLFQPCVSAYVGAWILADNIARLGPVWRAVGAYNARSPRLQWRYVQKVQKQLARQ